MSLDVVAVTTMQPLVPNERMARVDGILGSLAVAGMLSGSLAAPAVLALTELRVALVWAPASQRPSHSWRCWQWEGQMPRLPRTPPGWHRGSLCWRRWSFSWTSPQARAALAASMTEEPAPAGAVLIRQGEPAEDVYVLASGRSDAVVRRDSADVINTMSAPDLFGEIGVLRHQPRTATVIAVSDCLVYRISETAFLAAVNSGPALPVGLAATVRARLARTEHPAR